MPAIRKALQKKFEDRLWVVRFRHPLSQKVMRISLGPDQHIADGKLTLLNRVFLDSTKWAAPDLPKDLLDAWNGAKAGVRVNPHGIVVDGVAIPVSAGSTAAMMSVIERLTGELAQARAEATSYRKQLESVLGRKVRVGPAPILREALDLYKTRYLGRDADHTKTVIYDLERFVKDFGASTAIDDIEGKEKKIEGWLSGLSITRRDAAGNEITRPISSGRRLQIRGNVLKFLNDNGAHIVRKEIARPKRKDIRSERGGIRWLEKKEAEALAAALVWTKPTAKKKKHAPNPVAPKDQHYWSDLFRIQCGTGLRPDELITLHKNNFSDGLTKLTLAPLDGLSLKQGSRVIALPEQVQAIVRKRLKGNASGILFPHPDTGAAWVNPKAYNKRYREALRASATKAGIDTLVDCRTGRRTCGSILIRKGMTITQVAALLGDRESTVKEHYASLLPSEVDPSAAALN